MDRASSTAQAGRASRTPPSSAALRVLTCAISSWRTRGSYRSPGRAIWRCCSARRTSPGRLARARWHAFPWLAGRAATCSPASWTPIGFPEPTRSPSSATPAAAVPGPLSFRLGRRSTKPTPRGRCGSRPMAIAWRFSRARLASSTVRQSRWSQWSTSRAGPRPSRGAWRHWTGLGAIGKRDLVHGCAPGPDADGTAAVCGLARGRRAHRLSRARLVRVARHLRRRQRPAVPKHHSDQHRLSGPWRSD